ncbi:MAG TPA: hypothetical protein VNL15_06235 [Dehalococcoidia bacterium]|nr:hypothetical protein [Dehalococcoidia bacterium]
MIFEAGYLVAGIAALGGLALAGTLIREQTLARTGERRRAAMEKNTGQTMGQKPLPTDASASGSDSCEHEWQWTDTACTVQCANCGKRELA